jgi:hypothetical protein
VTGPHMAKRWRWKRGGSWTPRRPPQDRQVPSTRCPPHPSQEQRPSSTRWMHQSRGPARRGCGARA